jgi:hypothetical protein
VRRARHLLAVRSPSFKTAFKSVHKDAVFTELSLGQTHFAQGVYALDPTTAGIPPGTGALLAEYEGYVQGHKIRVGDIVWLKDGGKTVCAPMIGPYGPGVLGPLHSVKTGKNEEPVAPLSDGKGDEGDLHL